MALDGTPPTSWCPSCARVTVTVFCLRIDRCDRQTRGGPGMKRHDLDVVQVGPLRVEFAFAKAEPVKAFAGRFRRRIAGLGDLVVTLLRQLRPEPPLVPDEQLAEMPFAVLHLRQIDGPAAGLIRLPARDRTAAGKDGTLVAKSLIDDRRLLRTGILGTEGNRGREPVRAAANRDDDRTVPIGLGLFQFADRLLGALEAGKRPVGLVRLGLRELARPLVVAVGGHKEIRLGRLR